MRYVKAETILPENLLKEIQKYVQGEYIYIPTDNIYRKRWGEKSGARQQINGRNVEIRNKYKAGKTISELSEEFFLSIDSIKKIIYSKS
ncbi:CD3324 family protein [Clostridium sp. C8-1-8]|uniref:CD3324 family protein n=1 Tax=Clostridium sp. C8-1-8 TaxID=2698831 RepID=UPI0013691FA9|nr:CD3324 family protein [Clostridium sp. C8-1-8]